MDLSIQAETQNMNLSLQLLYGSNQQCRARLNDPGEIQIKKSMNGFIHAFSVG
jgi:hypothetical protein